MGCGLRGIAARIHSRSHARRRWAVACGESPLGYTGMACRRPRLTRCGLRGIAARIHLIEPSSSRQYCCGLRGIAARIHSAKLTAPTRDSAVACGESPLGYTQVESCYLDCSPLWLAGNRRSDTLAAANSRHALWLWLAGNRRSDTLLDVSQQRAVRLWLAGNRRSDTLMPSAWSAKRMLWLAGNRRSDTLRGIAGQAGSAVACGESPLGYTSRTGNGSSNSTLWLAGNRRSDTLAASSATSPSCCGLRGIAARIHW